MDPRPRRAGGVAVALLLAVALAPASAASAQVRPALQLDDLCWMGPNRPIVRARNLGDQPVPYTLRSGPAMRSGTLARSTPRDATQADATLGDTARADDDLGDAGSSAYFVASGRFPDADPVQLRWTADEGSGTEGNGGSEPHHCSYAVRPVLQWYDTDGAAMPAPTAAPAVVTLTGSLGRLVCDVVDGVLGCAATPSSDPPLPAGSIATRAGELAVPAFAVGGQAPTFSVSAAPPPGFRPDGTGTFTLPDLGSGLGQSNADDRLRPFFADEVERGVAGPRRRHRTAATRDGRGADHDGRTGRRVVHAHTLHHALRHGRRQPRAPHTHITPVALPGDVDPRHGHGTRVGASPDAGRRLVECRPDPRRSRRRGRAVLAPRRSGAPPVAPVAGASTTCSRLSRQDRATHGRGNRRVVPSP